MAAMIVVISHYSNQTLWLNKLLGGGAGQLGVMIFFLLSGFLMSYLYLPRDFNKTQIRNYVVARVARVTPLFLIVVTLSFLAQNTALSHLAYDIPDLSSLAAHLLLLQGVSVLWTIAPEVHFYFLFILIWATSLRWGGVLCVSASLVMVMLFLLRFPTINGELLGVQTNITLFRCLPYFIVGAILGRLYHSLKVPAHLSTGWFVMTLLFIPLLYPKIFFAITGESNKLWTDYGVLLVLSSVFFAVVFLVPKNNALLTNRLGDFLGKISYSLYLLHLPILWGLERYEIQNLEVRLTVFLGLCLTISYVSYKLIELPSSRFLRRFIRT